MPKLFTTLKRYPFSMAAYLLYSLFWLRSVLVLYSFNQQVHRSLAKGGEAVGWITLFDAGIGVMLGLTMLILYCTKNQPFYWKIMLLLAFQAVILGNC